MMSENLNKQCLQVYTVSKLWILTGENPTEDNQIASLRTKTKATKVINLRNDLLSNNNIVHDKKIDSEYKYKEIILNFLKWDCVLTTLKTIFDVLLIYLYNFTVDTTYQYWWLN